MRFIHIADMHFDTPFTVLSNHNNLGDLRRLEQRNVFKSLIEYIKKEKIPFLFIAGDLYEHQYVRNTTIEYINNLFQEIPETKIFIAPGNHDPILKNSYYKNYTWNDNVYIFNSEVEKFEFDDLDVYGVGFDDFYCKNSKINNIKIDDKNKINILVMHGDLNASENTEMSYNPINENKLKTIGFDYIALGHIHKQLINNNIVYPGSTVSLGFDELGEHGAIDVSLEKNKLDIKFVKLDNTEFVEKKIDLSQITTEEEVIETIKNQEFEANKLYKIVLTGCKNMEINTKKISSLLENKNIIKIKDETKMKYDIEKIAMENNLKGYFVREALQMQKDNNYTDDKTNRIIEIGLNALNN